MSLLTMQPQIFRCPVSLTFLDFWGIGGISPNIQIIKESCIASSDYFTLYERVPKIFISEKNIKPNKDSIQGKIEFKNIKFIYPSDKNQRPILDNLNL